MAVAIAVGCLAAWTSAALCGTQIFTTRDGLAGNKVATVLQDNHRRVWVGTTTGLSLYDGLSWRTYTTADGLANDSVVSILQDSSGSLWFGTDGGGVSRYDGVSWRTFTSADGLADGRVNDILQDRAGNLWFACDNGVSRYDGSTWQTYTTHDGLASNVVLALLQDHAGNLWFGCYGGLTRFDGSTWRSFTTADGLANRIVRTMLEDRAGNLWVGTARGLNRFDGSAWETLYPTDLFSAILEDRDGIWFGGALASAILYDGSRWRTVGPAEGLNVYGIEDLTEDTSGNLWFATMGGVVRYDKSSWRTFGTADGLTGLSVSDILEDTSGNLWTAAYGGVSRYDGSTWRTFTSADGLAGDDAFTILQDRAGALWFGGDRGVTRYDGSAWRKFTVSDGLADSLVFDILQDQAGSLWFATGKGASRYDGSTWRTFTTADGLAGNTIRTLFEDRAGNLWFSTYGYGVSRYDGATWRTFTTEDGLAGNEVYTILEDRAGNLWFGSYPGGVSRFDGTSWQRYAEPDAATDVEAIMEDHAGNLWFGTHEGVTRYDGSSWATVNAADGLASNIVHDVVEDRAGSLWFATFKGLTRYMRDRTPPRTVFLSVPPGVSATASQDVTFAPAFGEERIEFSDRLDDGPWSEWSEANTWLDPHLGDGPHQLEVRSRDMWHNVEADPARTAFEVDATPPRPLIVSPAFGQPVRGLAEIRGTTVDGRFREYRVLVRPSAATSWNAPDATLLASSGIPITNDVLARWDTSPLPDGSYDILVSIADTLGLVGLSQVSVVVDNHAPFFDQTTPARISAGAGGDVYTSNNDAHLYFPPHAFVEDAVVAMTPVEDGVTGPGLPSGVRILGGYQIDWAGTLRKPGRLTLNPDSPAPVPDDSAIYFSTDGPGWRRLGGTLDAGKKSLSLPVSEPGRYALLAGGGTGPVGLPLSALTFTPRVFSPTGSFADRQVGISFRLGKASPVTVKVFSPSGRLIREVAARLELNSGDNLVRWDGLDQEGEAVEDGIYLVTVEALGRTEMKSLAVVK